MRREGVGAMDGDSDHGDVEHGDWGAGLGGVNRAGDHSEGWGGALY